MLVLKYAPVYMSWHPEPRRVAMFEGQVVEVVELAVPVPVEHPETHVVVQYDTAEPPYRTYWSMLVLKYAPVYISWRPEPRSVAMFEGHVVEEVVEVDEELVLHPDTHAELHELTVE